MKGGDEKDLAVYLKTMDQQARGGGGVGSGTSATGTGMVQAGGVVAKVTSGAPGHMSASEKTLQVRRRRHYSP